MTFTEEREREWERKKKLTISQIKLDGSTSVGKVQYQSFAAGKLADQFQHLAIDGWNCVPRRWQKAQCPGTLWWFPLTLLPTMELHVGPVSHTLLSIDPQWGESHCRRSPFLAQGWRLHAWPLAAVCTAASKQKGKSPSPEKKKNTHHEHNAGQKVITATENKHNADPKLGQPYGRNTIHLYIATVILIVTSLKEEQIILIRI